MNRKRHAIWDLLLAELPFLRPSEYFIFLEDRHASFVRVDGGGRVSILLLCDVPDDDFDALDRFFASVIGSPAHFGQPMNILLANRQTFAYIKRQGALTAPQLFERVSSFSKDDLQVTQSTIPKSKSSYFVWQGVRKEYLRTITELVKKHGLAVTDIVPLDAVLLANGPTPDVGNEALNLYELPSGGWRYGVFKANGDVLFGLSPEEVMCDDIDTIKRRIDDSLGPWTDKRFDACLRLSDSKNKHGRVGKVIRSRLLQLQAGQALAYSPLSRRRAIAVRTTLNSSRLLAGVIALSCVLLALTSALTSIWAGSGTESLELFQDSYNSRMAATREVDSLESIQSGLLARQGQPRITAALISVFCQKSFSGLSLNNLTLNYDNGTTPTAEARGFSARESTVFSLREHLEELTGPHATATVNWVRPQSRASSQPGSDSVYEFSITLVVNETVGSK